MYSSGRHERSVINETICSKKVLFIFSELIKISWLRNVSAVRNVQVIAMPL